MQTEDNISLYDEASSESFEYEAYSDKKTDGGDYIFSLSVLQITLCILMVIMLFIMSFFGTFKEKTREAVDYFQSFELTKKDIADEISAMKSFLNDDKL